MKAFEFNAGLFFVFGFLTLMYTIWIVKLTFSSFLLFILFLPFYDEYRLEAQHQTHEYLWHGSMDNCTKPTRCKMATTLFVIANDYLYTIYTYSS